MGTGASVAERHPGRWADRGARASDRDDDWPRSEREAAGGGREAHGSAHREKEGSTNVVQRYPSTPPGARLRRAPRVRFRTAHEGPGRSLWRSLGDFPTRLLFDDREPDLLRGRRLSERRDLR